MLPVAPKKKNKNKNKNKNKSATPLSATISVGAATASTPAVVPVAATPDIVAANNAAIATIAAPVLAIPQFKAEVMNDKIDIVVKSIVAIKNEETVAQLVMFILMSALDRNLALSYLRTLPTSIIEIAAWSDEDSAVRIAGAIGCGILSLKDEVLPVTFLDVKKRWSARVGYANCFTVALLTKNLDSNTMDDCLRLSTCSMSYDKVIELVLTISTYCTFIKFKIDNSISGMIMRWAQAVVKVVLVKINSRLKVIFDKIYEVLSDFIMTAAIVVVSILVIAAAVRKRKEEGLLAKILKDAIFCYDVVLLYVVGSRAMYITLTIAAFSIWIFSLSASAKQWEFHEKQDEKLKKVFSPLLKAIKDPGATQISTLIGMNIPIPSDAAESIGTSAASDGRETSLQALAGALESGKHRTSTVRKKVVIRKRKALDESATLSKRDVGSASSD